MRSVKAVSTRSSAAKTETRKDVQLTGCCSGGRSYTVLRNWTTILSETSLRGASDWVTRQFDTRATSWKRPTFRGISARPGINSSCGFGLPPNATRLTDVLLLLLLAGIQPIGQWLWWTASRARAPSILFFFVQDSEWMSNFSVKACRSPDGPSHGFRSTNVCVGSVFWHRFGHKTAELLVERERNGWPFFSVNFIYCWGFIGCRVRCCPPWYLTRWEATKPGRCEALRLLSKDGSHYYHVYCVTIYH